MDYSTAPTSATLVRTCGATLIETLSEAENDLPPTRTLIETVSVESASPGLVCRTALEPSADGVRVSMPGALGALLQDGGPSGSAS